MSSLSACALRINTLSRSKQKAKSLNYIHLLLANIITSASHRAMTAWTTFISSSNQAPGRPQKWRESLSHRRSAHVGEQLLRLSDICTVHRTLLRLWLLLVAVSCVRSAPLPLSQNQNQEELQHQHGKLDSVASYCIAFALYRPIQINHSR